MNKTLHGSRSVKLTLPDGSKREFTGAITGMEIAAKISPSLAKAALAKSTFRAFVSKAALATKSSFAPRTLPAIMSSSTLPTTSLGSSRFPLA